MIRVRKEAAQKQHLYGWLKDDWVNMDKIIGFSLDGYKNDYGNIEKIGMENWLWTVPEEKLHELQVIFYDKHLLLGVE